MRYTVTTFKVHLEVCDQDDRTSASDDVMRCQTDLCKFRGRYFVLLALNHPIVSSYKM